MPNRNKDDTKGYQVKKERVERLTGLFQGVSRVVVEEVDESTPAFSCNSVCVTTVDSLAPFFPSATLHTGSIRF